MERQLHGLEYTQKGQQLVTDAATRAQAAKDKELRDQQAAEDRQRALKEKASEFFTKTVAPMGGRLIPVGGALNQGETAIANPYDSTTQYAIPPDPKHKLLKPSKQMVDAGLVADDSPMPMDLYSHLVTTLGSHLDKQAAIQQRAQDMANRAAEAQGRRADTKDFHDAMIQIYQQNADTREQVANYQVDPANPRNQPKQVKPYGAERLRSMLPGGGGPPSTGGPKPLDDATAKQYLTKAGGDKAKARQLAKADGYTF